MLKTLESTESMIQPGKSKIGVGGDRRAGHDGKCKFDKSKVDDDEGRDNKDDKLGKKGQKISKFKNLSKSKKTIRSIDFFTPRTRVVFTK